MSKYKVQETFHPFEIGEASPTVPARAGIGLHAAAICSLWLCLVTATRGQGSSQWEGRWRPLWGRECCSTNVQLPENRWARVTCALVYSRPVLKGADDE